MIFCQLMGGAMNFPSRVLFGVALGAMTSIAALPVNSAAAAKACTQVVLPVCAVNAKGERANYSNACFAKQAKARVLHAGNCLGPVCLFWWNPVCAIDPTTKKKATYSSLCAAENANATWVNDGSCK